MKRICAFALYLVLTLSVMAQGYRPSGTYTYAVKGSEELKLDVYDPVPGSETEYMGKEKPTVMFAFGGGFMSGRRNEGYLVQYFHQLNEAGYRVVSIDYRLGLKGVDKMGVLQASKLKNAIYMATEDMISATAWLLDHKEETKVDAGNIVLCGSSAGAITAMQSMYELANRSKLVRDLPESFRYAGVMSFSGAIYSTKGKLHFKNDTPPILMFHGTADKLVTYDQIKVLKWGFFGSDRIAERLAKFDRDYWFYRQQDHSHEIAGIMSGTVDKQIEFLEKAVIGGKPGTVDVMVLDESIEFWKIDPTDVYKKKKKIAE